MNYRESKKILEEIKKAKRILVSCHRGPDMDSVGSATAMAGVLVKLGKKATIVCTSKIPEDLIFLKRVKEIKALVNFEHFDYSNYDLFIALDSSNWQMIAFNTKAEKPKIKFVVIDHHKTNEMYGDINLVDPDVTSVGELLNYVFDDWGVNVDKDIAKSLLTGILGDTGVFMYPGSGKKTFEVVQELISKGADKDEIIRYAFRTREFLLTKFLGEIINKMQIDEDHKFVWSAIPYEVYDKYGKPENGKEVAASMFMQSIKNTDFGIVMTEIKKGELSVSFRSRTGFDVSGIATELGGGGHLAAAGARIQGKDFNVLVDKVLRLARKYAKKS